MVTATDFVRESLEELDGFFGVRGSIPAEALVRFHKAGDQEALFKAIAHHLGLPIQARLSFTSVTTQFRSHHLARTDDSGRGIEGIEAQVAIPSNLPLLGTPQLRGYPIDVLLGPAFASARAETAITFLAHEFSHVLLHSLRHPKRDSELFTDLVPLVHGFGEVVQRGRSVSFVTYEGNVMRTTTTAYGYLSHADFSFALEKVKRLWHEREQRRRGLLENVVTLRNHATRNTELLARFTDLKRHVDATLRRVRRTDAIQIVAMHAPDFAREFELTIQEALQVAARAEEFAKSVVHYSKQQLEELRRHEERCATAALRLKEAFAQLKADAAILARNCDMRTRLWDGLRAIVSLSMQAWWYLLAIRRLTRRCTRRPPANASGRG